MTTTMLAALLLLAQMSYLTGLFVVRYRANRQLFKTNRPLKPVNTKNPVFSPFNGLFNLMDRIPLLRRSGTANELDFLKAVMLTVVPIFLLNVLMSGSSWLVILLGANVLVFLVSLILTFHNALKGGK
jgi:hypothetical protein